MIPFIHGFFSACCGGGEKAIAVFCECGNIFFKTDNNQQAAGPLYGVQ